MVIYIEKVIIFNILIHLLLVLITYYITNNKVNKIMLIISLLIGSVYMFVYLLFPHNIFFSYIIIILIGYIPTKQLKSTLIYFMLNFTLGGIVGVINLSLKYYYEILLMFSILLLFIFIYIKNKDSNQFKHIVIVSNKEYKLKAFVDTGCDINLGFTPIIIISECIDIELEYFTDLEVDTINGKKIQKVFKAKRVFLLKKNTKIEKNCLFIISKIDFDVIVGINFLGGL